MLFKTCFRVGTNLLLRTHLLLLLLLLFIPYQERLLLYDGCHHLQQTAPHPAMILLRKRLEDLNEAEIITPEGQSTHKNIASTQRACGKAVLRMSWTSSVSGVAGRLV